MVRAASRAKSGGTRSDMSGFPRQRQNFGSFEVRASVADRGRTVSVAIPFPSSSFFRDEIPPPRPRPDTQLDAAAFCFFDSTGATTQRSLKSGNRRNATLLSVLWCSSASREKKVGAPFSIFFTIWSSVAAGG